MTPEQAKWLAGFCEIHETEGTARQYWWNPDGNCNMDIFDLIHYLQSPAFLPVLLGALRGKGLYWKLDMLDSWVGIFKAKGIIAYERLSHKRWTLKSDPIGLQALTQCVLEAHEKGDLR